MQNNINVEEKALTKMYNTWAKTLEPASIKLLNKMIVESCDRKLTHLINYLDNPKTFKFEGYGVKDTVLINIDTLYGQAAEELSVHNLVVDGFFVGRLENFNFLKGEYGTISYRNHNNDILYIHIYLSSVKIEKLL